MRIEREEEIEFSEPKTWVPDGVYTAKCIDYSKPTPYRGTRKIYLKFKILTEPYVGEEIFMAFDVGYGHVSREKRYSKFWTIANKDKPPSRNAKGSPRIFLNKTFRIVTRTVKPKIGPTIKLKNDSGIEERELPKECWYSIIDYFELLKLNDTKDDREVYQ